MTNGDDDFPISYIAYKSCGQHMHQGIGSTQGEADRNAQSAANACAAQRQN